jgi:hypothetical protein
MKRGKSMRQSKDIKKLVHGALYVLLICVASPSLSIAAEKWTCEYKFLSGSEKGLAGESKIEISGTTLKRFVESPVPFLPKPKISTL